MTRESPVPDEVQRLLERYPTWPHRPRRATSSQVAHFARLVLEGATLTEVRSAARLEALVGLHPLAWDTDMLGVKTGRMTFVVPPDAACDRRETAREAVAAARDKGYASLFTRVDASELDTVQALEAAGFETVDAILSQYLWVSEAALPSSPIEVRSASRDDSALLGDLTDATMAQSRFHSDPRVGAARARSIYRQWGQNTVLGLNDLTLICEVDGEPAGYLSAKDVKASRAAFGWGYCRIELVAVLERFRGTGLVAAMTARLIAECPSRRWDLCGIGTQIGNIRAMRAYAKVGFAPGDSILTLRWRAS